MRPGREHRAIPPESPADVYGDLVELRVYLDVLRVHHLDLAKRFISVADGSLYTIDLFLFGVTQRSYHLVDAFLSLIDEWNIIGAAPLVRMQIDNLTRVTYVATAPRADEIAEEFIGGTEFRHMRAPDGQKLTDRKLLDLALADLGDWVEPVYEATSGWVHLSPLHVHHAWEIAEEADETASIAGEIPLRPQRIPETSLAELLGAMTKATEQLFGWLERWEERKGLPPGQTRNLGAS
jgi:hypothetical protein